MSRFEDDFYFSIISSFVIFSLNLFFFFFFSDKDICKKYVIDFEERERALINGYNAEITKYKTQVSQLRLQLAHTKSSVSPLSPTKAPIGKGKENLSNQVQIKQYLLRQVKRLQDELDKNSQSVAEVQQALELKKATEIDLEQRLAYESAGHRKAKALISELKAKVKRLGERCRSASFEAEKTFAALESELSLIENQSISVKEEFSEQDSFQSALESSFDLTKVAPDNRVTSDKENQLFSAKVTGDADGEQEKPKKKTLGENGSSFRLDPGCLEQKIVNKNMEIVRLQERLLAQSKLEQDLKILASKNAELVTQLKDMSQLQAELKKKVLLIRDLEDKVKNTEVLEVEVESQALVIQRLQAAIDERSLLLAKLQRPTSNGSSPVSDRKLEEMEMVMAGLREMVDKSTKELTQRDEKIQELITEKSSAESLKNEVQSLTAATTSLEGELQTFKKEKETYEVFKKTLENELETLKRENSRISESKNSLEKELEKSKKENKEICNLKNSLEKNLENLELENKTVNDLKNSLLKNLENLKSEHETISNLKKNLEKDLEISKTEVKTILDLKSSLATELEGLKAENELISSMKNSLEKDLRNSEEEKDRMSTVKNSLENEIQILKEENRTILKQKECLHSELLSVQSELESKSQEIVSLKSALLSKESAGEKSNAKATNELKNSLAMAKMAQRELEENLQTKKKELRAKDIELTKMSELLEQKNRENADLESKISVLCRDQDELKCQETEQTQELEKQKETNDNLPSKNTGNIEEERCSSPQEEKMKALEKEVSTLEKSLEDNVLVREKLLVENSGLVSLLAEKDRLISELTRKEERGEGILKTVTPAASDEERVSPVAQLKGDPDTEKQYCEELTVKLEMATDKTDKRKSENGQNLTTMQMKVATNVECLQVNFLFIFFMPISFCLTNISSHPISTVLLK